MTLSRFVLLIFLLALCCEGNRKFLGKKVSQKGIRSNSSKPDPESIKLVRKDFFDDIVQQTVGNQSISNSTQSPPKASPSTQPDKENDSYLKIDKTVIIIVTWGAAVILILAIVLCCWCCIKRSRRKNGAKDLPRDDKPLLNMCSSDVSGSSQKSPSIRTPGGMNEPSDALPLPPGRKAPPPESPLAAAAAAAPAPAAAAPPPPKPPGPAPPPPPKPARPPPAPNGKPRGLNSRASGGDENDSQKAKLKPFFWDKVQANPDDSMVWHDLRAGSFQVNEEMMESLFGYTPAEKNTNERRKETSDSVPQYIKIIDPKKSQNLAILLKALNVTTVEVCDALTEGNELPVELVQTLLKMAPTTEEELKLRLFNGDHNSLGPAEQFLKVIVDIPFAFKRLESLLFMITLQEEVSHIQESLKTLEVASTELRNSRLFLKLLEAVLKTGNRMNDGTFRGGAQAFKLDTLLKLSDVKGTDGKTTLLHFVVQEIIRSEGVRAAKSKTKTKDPAEGSGTKTKDPAEGSGTKTKDPVEGSTPPSPEYYRGLGLQVVSALSTNLENVKKAAAIDGDSLRMIVSKLHGALLKNKKFLDNEMKNLEQESRFKNTLEAFVKKAEAQIAGLPEEEKKIMAMVKNTADYFHGNSGKDEGLRLFVIVRDFLVILDKVCKELSNSTMIPKKVSKIETSDSPPSQSNSFDARRKLFPAIMDRRLDDFSSDDDISSP